MAGSRLRSRMVIIRTSVGAEMIREEERRRRRRALHILRGGTWILLWCSRLGTGKGLERGALTGITASEGVACRLHENRHEAQSDRVRCVLIVKGTGRDGMGRTRWKLR